VGRARLAPLPPVRDFVAMYASLMRPLLVNQVEYLDGVAEAGFFPGVAFMVPNRIPTEGAGRPAW